MGCVPRRCARAFQYVSKISTRTSCKRTDSMAEITVLLVPVSLSQLVDRRSLYFLPYKIAMCRGGLN
eukprot:759906-Hanusia_phi.AAC.4